MSSVACRLSPASAAAFFHGEPRQVKACVLLLPSTAPTPGSGFYPDGQNLNPYVFFVMDQREDLKPPSWEFVNPLAPPTVTQAMAARWSRLGSSNLTPGIPLTKDLASYWEVPLTQETIDRLETMDICYVCANGAVRMTYQDRELLRRLVDAGVLLWLDDGGSLSFHALDGMFFPVNFQNGGGGNQALMPAHPLLNGHFQLTTAQVAQLGRPGNGRSVSIQPPASEGTQLQDPNRPGLARQAVLSPVVGNPGTALAGATVAAAQYGSGYLLCSAGDLGGVISGAVGAGAHAVGNLQAAQSEALQLAYNAVGWTNEVTHVLKNPRRNGAGGDTLAGSLARWSFTQFPVPYATWLQPLIARNQVFALIPPTGGPNSTFTIHSFDLNPLDTFTAGGNNPDDGIPDLSLGRPYDEIDHGALGEFSWISGMAYGEQNGVGYLFVTGGENGSLQAASAGTTFVEAIPVPTPSNPRFGAPNIWKPQTGSKDVNIRTIWSAPAYFDGLLIAAGGTQGNALDTGNPGVGAVGDMRALRVVNGQLAEQWHYPQGNAPEVGPIVSPVVVANILDPRSGATDTTVLYTSLTIASSPGGLGGIVIHTAGEPMVALDDGRTWQPSRRVENWDPNQWYDIRVIDNATGYTVTQYTPASTAPNQVQLNVENQPGRIRLPLPVAPTRFSVVAEYSLLNLREGTTGGMIRRFWVPSFNPPGGNLPASGISAGPSVDAHGNVYIATGNGYVASVRFVGGTPIVNWKARSANAHDNQNFLGQQHVVEPFKPGRLSDHLFVSTPTWRDGILYVAGRDGTVYAFQTETDFTIKVPFTAGLPPMSPNRPYSVVLYSNESDFTNMNGPNPRTNRVPPDAYTINADAGTVTITNMRNVTLDLANAVAPDSIPKPGIGDRYGIPIAVDYIDVNGQQQSDTSFIPLNLLYKFQTGGGSSVTGNPYVFESSPVVAGDHVYVIGNRSTSGSLISPADITQQKEAVLFELPADPRQLDNRFIAGSDVGTWPPQGAETTRPPGWMVTTRLISGKPVLAPPAISDNMMVIATGEGITAYQGAKTLIADANRVLEVDADGRAQASMDATTKLQPVGSDFPIPADPDHVNLAGTAFTTTTKHLDRPSVVRQLSRDSSLASIFYSTGPTEAHLVGEHSEMAPESALTADTGNDRVVETNAFGKVIWELTTFQDPFKLLPPGEPLKLSEPMDVQRWVDTENSSRGTLLVVHTLVADSGNTRVIEIVDKILYQQGNYDPNSFAFGLTGQVDWQNQPVRWHHVLVWTSQTNAQGLQFRYRTAQRLYATDTAGHPKTNANVQAGQYPRPAMSSPPFLPAEPYQSVTMATISNARVYYALNKNDPHYGDTQRNIPQSLPGADSIVFLRSNRTDIKGEPFWTPDPTSTTGYKYVQGSIGNPADGYPILSDIWSGQGGEHVVHTLNGVTSLQRNFRRNLADKDLYNPRTPLSAGNPKAATYYLIADGSGVFEFWYDPSQPVGPPTPQNPFTQDHGPRLAWSFTNDDYNYVTGGGQGNPNAVRAGATGAYTGGRVLTAASARLLPNGDVLIASRTAGNASPAGGPPVAGGEIFTLRINDANPAVPISSSSPWIPDAAVQLTLHPGGLVALPSITWRAPAPLNPLNPPTLLPVPGSGFNPLDIGNTYLPDQPAYADLVF
jgi:hypothetical protein